MRLRRVLTLPVCSLLMLACSAQSQSPLEPENAADSGIADATASDTGEPNSGDSTVGHDVEADETSPESAPPTTSPPPYDAAPQGPPPADAETADTGAGQTDSGPQPDSSTPQADGGGHVADAGGCPLGQLVCAGSCVPNDARNCGNCGTTCSGNTPICEGTGSTRSCTSACASGLTPCGTSCVDTKSDSSNCGGCGPSFVCSGGKTCQSGQCKCQAGSTHDCSGTCMTNTSVSSCGMSCSVCPSGPTNGHATCDGAFCGTACNASYTPCAGACVNEQLDNSNCGGCGASFACATGKTCASGVCTAVPQTKVVHVAPNAAHVFQPSSVTIHVGDTVMWTWDFGGHTVTSGSSCSAPDNKFCSPSNIADCSASPTSNAGATYSHTFTSAGTFPYFCIPHCQMGMTGAVIVQ